MSTPTSPTAQAHEIDRHAGSDLTFLALAAAAYALAQTAVVPGLTVMADDLGASPADVGWVLTAYLISAAILTPVFGRLGDMYGKKRILLASLAFFVVGSVGAALSSSIGLLIAARVLQGAGGGIFPLCFGIIGDSFPRQRQSAALGLISALAGIGAGAGLLMGGLLVDNASWHWIFWVGAIMATIAFVGALRLPHDQPSGPAGGVDIPGVVVLAIGLTAPLLALSQSADWGWGDERTLGLLIGGLLVLVGFVWLERRVAEPLIDVRLLASRGILIPNIAMLLFGAGMFGLFSLVPRIAETPESVAYGLGLDATGAGLILVPGSIAMLLASVGAGRLAARTRPSVPIVVGAALAALGLGLLSIEHGSSGSIIGLSVLVFIGIGFGMAAMPSVVMSAAPAGKTGEATGVNALVRSVGSSIGSQVVTTILATKVFVVVGGVELPTDDAFSLSFLVVAGAALIAAVAAAFIPNHVHEDHRAADEAAVPVVEPSR